MKPQFHSYVGSKVPWHQIGDALPQFEAGRSAVATQPVFKRTRPRLAAPLSLNVSSHMRTLSLVLKLAAPVFIIVGALHLVLGVGADVLLGAKLPVEALGDPALDSQNRFYGISFTLYGVLLFVCASDLSKYATVQCRT